MRRNRSTTLFCFSPPVMLATFLIEITFAAYVLWRYKMTTVTRLVVAILACLTTFQGAEFMLCGGFGLHGGWWSRLGYSAITLLPPLGIHLTMAITEQKNKYLLAAAYATAAGFVAYFTFFTQAISGHTCYANYAVFDMFAGNGMIYALYYYGWLVVGTGLAWQYSRTFPEYRTALTALAIGYLSFIVPTTAVNIIDPSTIAGIPSIMCGFAVILAFILVGKVAPETIAIKDDDRSLFRFIGQ